MISSSESQKLVSVRCYIFGRKFTWRADKPLDTYSYRTSSRTVWILSRWLARKIFCFVTSNRSEMVEPDNLQIKFLMNLRGSHWSVVRLERFSLECGKVISFAFSTPHDWLKKFRAIFSANQKYSQNQLWLVHTRFPALLVFPRFASGTFSYLELWLVHWIACVLCDWLECLYPFWLARVMALVLVLPHSIENYSI